MWQTNYTWRPFKWQTTCGCVAAKVKLCVYGLGLLLPKLNSGPVTAAPLKAVCENVAIHK